MWYLSVSCLWRISQLNHSLVSLITSPGSPLSGPSKMIARFILNVLKGAQNGLMTDNFKLHIVYILVFYVKSAALGENCWLFGCLESVSVPLSDLLVCWLGQMFVEYPERLLHPSVDVVGLWVMDDCWKMNAGRVWSNMWTLLLLFCCNT